MGAPGAGKGTQGDMLVERYGWKKVSTGDLLREQIQQGGPKGEELAAIINKGELVSDAILAEMISAAAERFSKETMLLDGFPRSLPQAQLLEKVCESSKLLGVFHLEVDPDVLIERLSGRLVCRKCAASFHIHDLPPKRVESCDHCDGELYTRADDKPEKVENRLRVYQKHTQPVVDYFKKLGCYTAVDGVGSALGVFEKLHSAVDLKLEALVSQE